MRAAGQQMEHLLIGPAGVGKSLLVAVLVKLMTERGLGSLRGSGFTGVSAVPYRMPTLCTLLAASA